MLDRQLVEGWCDRLYTLRIPKELPQSLGPFQYKSLILYEGSPDYLEITLGSVLRDDQEEAGIMLDINYYLANAEAVSFENVSDWLENAHNNVEIAFEACITDKARELFGEKQ